MSAMVKDYLDRVVAAYMDAVDFTESEVLADMMPDEDTPFYGFDSSMDDEAREDCIQFLDNCLVANLNFLKFNPGPEWPMGYGPEQIGIDFWLTRNRHGAGFWDRGLGDIGEKLTDIAHQMGERSVYVGEDGWARFD